MNTHEYEDAIHLALPSLRHLVVLFVGLPEVHRPEGISGLDSGC